MADTYESDCIKCPHCGYEHDCPEEYFSRMETDTTVECAGDNCGKKFAVTRHFSVDYAATSLEKEKP